MTQDIEKNTNVESAAARRKPAAVSVIAIYFFFLSVVARTFTEVRDGASVPPVLIGLGFFLLLMSLVIWVVRLPEWLIHLFLVFQMILTVVMQNITPQDDFENLLFVLISFQVGLIFQGRTLAAWIIVLIPVTCISLTYSMGGLEGLSKSFINIAGEVAIFAYFIAVREIDAAKERRRKSVNELKEIHARLEDYARQVDELAALEERNRLARELHDSVSQTLFSISLNIRTAQIMFRKDPSLVKGPLEALRSLTESALAEIRGLITQMRPQAK